MNLNSLKKKTLLILLGVFFIGLVLKLINFWDIQIFAYDQARDAQRILEILSGNFKLVGPETDIKGVFNGPLFYYLLAPIYFLSNFNPNIVGLFMILVNLSGIFLIYYLSKVLFNNKAVGLLSGFLWAISYEQANFARFISNSSFMGITSLIFFLGLALYFLRENKWGFPISVLGLGMAIHFNFYLGYLIIFYPLFFFMYKKKPVFKEIALSGLLFFAIVSPFLIAELKWNFMSTKALISYFLSHSGESNSFLSNLNSYPARISGALYYGFFWFSKSLAILLLLSALGFLYKTVKTERKSLIFLFIWTFSTLPLFFFKSGVLTAEVINSSIFGALTIVFGLFIYKLFISKRYMLLGVGLLIVIVVSNLTLFIRDDFKAFKLFSLQTLVLGEEKQLIDYTYKSSGGKEFSVCALTNPLFINSLWSYLYHFYGKSRYGYVPYWSGQKQYLNSSLIPYDMKKVQDRYLIIEPLGGLPDFTAWATIYMEDQVSVLEEEKHFGTLIVQKRRLDYNKGNPRDTQHLSSDLLSRTISLVSVEQRYSCYNNY